MAIRFELGDDDDGGVAFGYSPLLESVLSLHVLAEPKHHALQHGWVRAMRALPASLRREIAALVVPLPLDAARTASCRPRRPATTTSRSSSSGSGACAPTSSPSSCCGRSTTTAAAHVRARRRILSSPEVRAVALKRAGTLGPRARRAAALLFDDPARLVERFASLLEAYWEQAFAAEWARIEPQLAESVELAGRQIADDGMGAFLVTLAPQLRVDPGARSFGLDVPHDHRVPITREEPAAARAERLRVAARARQLRRAVAARGRLPRAAPRQGTATLDAAASSCGC